MHVRCTGGGESFGHAVVGEFGSITIATEMAQIDVMKIRGDQFFENGGSGFVGKMTMAAEDALFHAPRTFWIVLQQFHVVICFEHEHVRTTHPFYNQFRGVAEIGKETDLMSARTQREADRIVRIVRNRKRVDTDLAHFKRSAGAEMRKSKFVSNCISTASLVSLLQ